MNREENEADVLDQRREITEDEQVTPPPTVDTEVNPADLQEQNQPVPSEEEDWPDA
ncbi:hypothetical protein [Actinophytocola gossypii]|uniref:Uncharacterized protein n=1 Tax=Actinophytocola gossypii TaxID=2812003 RepID=A0ABT2J6K1_9PSEU|nr:hypothetical protein [Actinophytocola gossypii]MCT2583413.1 hypothetical protein [Actinophytocola gossypii]